MRLSIITIALLSSALLSACATNACDKAQETTLDYNAKIGPCASIDPRAFNNAYCEQNLRSCSLADAESIEQTHQCMARLAPCLFGQEDAFRTNAQACFAYVRGISAGCTQAISH